MGVKLPVSDPGPLGITLGWQLQGVPQCPHCSISNPVMRQVWDSASYIASSGRENLERADGRALDMWAVYSCSTCGSLVMVKANPAQGFVTAIFPSVKKAHEDLPAMAKIFLQQAFDTLHAPDAAAVMAGSAVDAMLKDLGYTDGTLYARIDKARDEHLLTQGMADWAHEVRLGSNRPRHADENRPHVSVDEAKQSVEFAEALGQFLFVLTARTRRGIALAKEIAEKSES